MDSAWIRYIQQRINNNKNFIAAITGPTGSGKSWSGLSIGEQIDPNFSIKNVEFRGKLLLKLINSNELPDKRGNFIMWDEAGVDISNRTWQSQANRLVNYLLQTFRHRCFILFFTVPYSDFIDVQTRKLFHAEFRTRKIDKSTSKCILHGYNLQYNSAMRKWYRKYLRRRTKEGWIKMKNWGVIKPSDKLIREYEKKRGVFTSELNKEIEQGLNMGSGIKKEKQFSEKDGKIYTLLAIGVSPKNISLTEHIPVRTIRYIRQQFREAGYLIPAVKREKCISEKKENIIM